MAQPKLTFFQGTDASWRWRLRGKNGAIIADSAEGNGYKTLAMAQKGWSRVAAAVLDNTIKVEVLTDASTTGD